MTQCRQTNHSNLIAVQTTPCCPSARRTTLSHWSPSICEPPTAADIRCERNGHGIILGVAIACLWTLLRHIGYITHNHYRRKRNLNPISAERASLALPHMQPQDDTVENEHNEPSSEACVKGRRECHGQPMQENCNTSQTKEYTVDHIVRNVMNGRQRKHVVQW